MSTSQSMNMRDTTEVTIDGKSMKVGDVGKNTNIKDKLSKKNR